MWKMPPFAQDSLWGLIFYVEYFSSVSFKVAQEEHLLDCDFRSVPGDVIGVT